MKVVIKKSARTINKATNYKKETYEIITRENVVFLSYKIYGNKVTAI